MIQSYIITLIGDDQPGLVVQVADIVEQNKGNWQDSRLSNMLGKFAGIISVSVPDENKEQFFNDIKHLKHSGLSVRAHTTKGAGHTTDKTVRIHVTANDRTGIMNEVTSALKTINVNIEELSSQQEPAAMSNDTLFISSLTLTLPTDVTHSDISRVLENLSDDLVIDFEQE